MQVDQEATEWKLDISIYDGFKGDATGNWWYANFTLNFSAPPAETPAPVPAPETPAPSAAPMATLVWGMMAASAGVMFMAW